jgi:hypothetical protein
MRVLILLVALLISAAVARADRYHCLEYNTIDECSDAIRELTAQPKDPQTTEELFSLYIARASGYEAAVEYENALQDLRSAMHTYPGNVKAPLFSRAADLATKLGKFGDAYWYWHGYLQHDSASVPGKIALEDARREYARRANLPLTPDLLPPSLNAPIDWSKLGMFFAQMNFVRLLMYYSVGIGLIFALVFFLIGRQRREIFTLRLGFAPPSRITALRQRLGRMIAGQDMQ